MSPGGLNDHGIGVTVVDPRWVKPVDPARHRHGRPAPPWFAVVEDNGRAGGFGDAGRAGCCATPTWTPPVKTYGLDQEFLTPRHPGADPRGGRADAAATWPAS